RWRCWRCCSLRRSSVQSPQRRAFAFQRRRIHRN
ncbi:uncharacterized protein METZ01_LOCUS111710, partial [marine metagenome]